MRPLNDTSELTDSAGTRLDRTTAGGLRARGLTIVSILLLTLAAYLSALHGPFLLDDFTNVLPSRPDSAGWRSLLAVTFGNESGALGRPIPTLSFALQFLAGADSPLPFKIFNLGVHLLNAALFALLLDRLILAVRAGPCRTSEVAEDRFRNMALLAGVAAFALHPLQVSTVMYVVQRMALMSHTFGLGAMLLYVIARQQTGSNIASRLVAVAGVVLLSTLSVLCKESGALVPAYIVLIELVVLRAARGSVRSAHPANGLRFSDTAVRLTLVACVAFVLLVALLAVRSGWLDPLMIGYDSKRYTLGERLASQPVVLLEYLRMITWPDPMLMSFHHDDIDVQSIAHHRILLSSVAVVAMFGMMLATVGRMPLVSAGIGIYLASHLLESTVFPLEPMFEHRNYVGLTGIGILCAGLFEEFRSWRPAAAVAVILVGALSAATGQRALLWSNDLAIQRHAVEAAPDSLRARSAYAIALARGGAVDRAVVQLDAAATLAPADPYFPLERLQTLALAGRATSADIVRAGRVLETGEPSLPTESVLMDLKRNLDAGRLGGITPASLSDLYTVAERRYGDFAARSSHARLIAAAAEAHLLAGRNERAIASIDRSANLAPTRARIAVRRLELRAGLAPESVGPADVRRVADVVPETHTALHDRLAAIIAHLSRKDTKVDRYADTQTD